MQETLAVQCEDLLWRIFENALHLNGKEHMRISTLFLAVIFSAIASAQLNISLVGELDYQDLRNSNLSNLWGYTDETGIEYALVGVNGGGGQGTGGISVVSLEDPANPEEVFFFAGPNSIWREVKVWEDHVYVTTEAQNGGLTIVDLSPLPQNTDLTATVWMAPDWDTSHSLFIDENGRLYLHGSNRGNGGVIMYDLTQDPMNPVEVGEYDDFYVHDSFARGDTLYAAHIYDGFFTIVDVSDPTDPVLLGTQSTPNDFTHNTWLDASGQFLYTTDERPGSYIAAYDVNDPTDIQEVDRLRSEDADNPIIHNTYWRDYKLYHSYYTRGIAIYDATYPHNLVEVGMYDTSPFTGDDFNGAWGVYPYFESGLIIVSDIEQGLVVLQPSVQLPCWLEGVVTNAVTSAPIGNATVQITNLNISEVTPISGDYATGYHTAGTYTVEASAPGFFSETITGVVLQNGVLTQLDIELQPMIAFSFQGNVVTEGTTDPVANAIISITSPSFQLSTQADANGMFDFPAVFADEYVITAGRWGWRTVCLPQELEPGSSPLTIELPVGYADDFALDLGWTNTSSASSGDWERGEPVGTDIADLPSNPDLDAIGDCGELAYVTGNGGGSAGDDDVDGGAVTLRSPLFDATAETEPHVLYYRWFVNVGGNGDPNDLLTIALDNGITVVTVETVSEASTGDGTWVPRNIRIEDFITPTANMQLVATASDQTPGHVVEAGLDRFELVYQNTNAVVELDNGNVQIWPNPNNGYFRIGLPASLSATLELSDATGRLVHRERITQGDTAMDVGHLPSGTYTLRAITAEGSSYRTKIIVIR